MEKYSIYVHIPFCKARCAYCAFSSCTNFALEDAYFDILCGEISQVSARTDSGEKFTIKTMFWGGGTPSSVKTENLQKLHSALKGKFDLSALEEFTVECNPESTTPELLNFFKSIGVNRLSFGLQSANDATLKKIGRLHSYDDFLRTLDLARSCGFSNLNADLILGLPESFEEFCRTVETVRALPLTHISVYALEIHPEKTAFKALCDSYGYTDDDLADMYDFALQKFEAAGYARYEVSNFAKCGYECRHNLNYWREGRYFGFGAAASGFVQNVRYGNAFDIEKYIQCGKLSESCGVATEYRDQISPGEEMSEFVMLGLRLDEGISLAEFNTRYEADFYERFPAAKRLIERGFLKAEGGRVRVPEGKFYVLNSILTELL